MPDKVCYCQSNGMRGSAQIPVVFDGVGNTLCKNCGRVLINSRGQFILIKPFKVAQNA